MRSAVYESAYWQVMKQFIRFMLAEYSIENYYFLVLEKSYQKNPTPQKLQFIHSTFIAPNQATYEINIGGVQQNIDAAYKSYVKNSQNNGNTPTPAPGNFFSAAVEPTIQTLMDSWSRFSLDYCKTDKSKIACLLYRFNGVNDNQIQTWVALITQAEGQGFQLPKHLKHIR